MGCGCPGGKGNRNTNDKATHVAKQFTRHQQVTRPLLQTRFLQPVFPAGQLAGVFPLNPPRLGPIPQDLVLRPFVPGIWRPEDNAVQIGTKPCLCNEGKCRPPDQCCPYVVRKTVTSLTEPTQVIINSAAVVSMRIAIDIDVSIEKDCAQPFIKSACPKVRVGLIQFCKLVQYLRLLRLSPKKGAGIFLQCPEFGKAPTIEFKTGDWLIDSQTKNSEDYENLKTENPDSVRDWSLFPDVLFTGPEELGGDKQRAKLVLADEPDAGIAGLNISYMKEKWKIVGEYEHRCFEAYVVTQCVDCTDRLAWYVLDKFSWGFKFIRFIPPGWVFEYCFGLRQDLTAKDFKIFRGTLLTNKKTLGQPALISSPRQCDSVKRLEKVDKSYNLDRCNPFTNKDIEDPKNEPHFKKVDDGKLFEDIAFDFIEGGVLVNKINCAE